MAAPLRQSSITRLLGHHTGALVGSRADLLRLGALFRLAAVSPHSAVFLPFRANPPDGLTAACWTADQGLADLLIVRRDVPLRPSDWPAIRARVRRGPRAGVPAIMRAPAPRPLAGHWGLDWQRHQLSAAEHADTVLLSGSAQALFAAGDQLTWCGDQVAVNSDLRRHGGPVLLGQLTGSERPPGRSNGSWECMVLAEDRLFCRNRQPPATAKPISAARPVDRRGTAGIPGGG